jgi:hypothetical protein
LFEVRVPTVIEIAYTPGDELAVADVDNIGVPVTSLVPSVSPFLKPL